MIVHLLRMIDTAINCEPYWAWIRSRRGIRRGNTAQEFGEHDAECVDIRSGRNAAHELFGRHIAIRPGNRRTASLQKRVVDVPEVRQIDFVILAIGFEKDIRRFDIAVNDRGIVMMKFFENIDDLYGQRKDVLNAETNAGLDGVGQRFAANELLDEVGVRLVFVEFFDGFVKRRDTRNVERLQCFGFAPEEFIFFPVLDGVDLENFDGDGQAVGFAFGGIDAALRATAQKAREGIAVGDIGGGKPHPRPLCGHSLSMLAW